MQTRYGYFRIPVPNAKRDGVICVRLDCPEKGEALNYKAAMCFCSPKDTFSKKLAYKLLGFRFCNAEAVLRRNDQRRQNIIELKYDDEKPPRSDQIMREALNKALGMKRYTKSGFEKPFVPNWVRKRVRTLGDGTLVTPDYEGAGSMAIEMGMTGGQ
jgi:hypothetical protein